MRVKRGIVRKRKHQKLYSQTKSFYGQRKNVFKRAKEAILHAGNFAFRDRRVKKRVIRQGWIRIINIACRENDIKYSELIHGLKKANIDINRKILCDLAQNNGRVFSSLIKQVKSAK